MITTPSMGLKRWDQPNDIFSYVELSDNFALIDNHDHTSGKGVQIPTAGIANLAIDSTKIANSAVTNGKLATDAVTDAKVLSATLTDAKLASPNNGLWRTLMTASGTISAATAGAEYAIGHGYMSPVGVSTTTIPAFFPWIASEYAVAGKTTKLRFIVLGAANDTASGGSAAWTFWWRRANTTVSGTGGNITITTNTPTATISNIGPAGEFYGPHASTEFTPSLDANYVISGSPNANLAAGAVIGFNGYLQIRHV